MLDIFTEDHNDEESLSQDFIVQYSLDGDPPESEYSLDEKSVNYASEVETVSIEENICDEVEASYSQALDANEEVEMNKEPVKDGSKRLKECPSKSYRTLIMEVLQESPNGVLTLDEIYHNILIKYPEFENRKEHFRKALRDTLSVNNNIFINFSIGEGRGGFWKLNPYMDNVSTARRKRQRETNLNTETITEGSMSKIFKILKPMCESENFVCEKKYMSCSDFIEVYNPFLDEEPTFFPTMNLIVYIDEGTLILKIFFQQRILLKENSIKDIECLLSSPYDEDHRRIKAALSYCLSELRPRKYAVCRGAFSEKQMKDAGAAIDSESVLIEREDSAIIYRARHCAWLIEKELKSAKCNSCSQLKLYNDSSNRICRTKSLKSLIIEALNKAGNRSGKLSHREIKQYIALNYPEVGGNNSLDNSLLMALNAYDIFTKKLDSSMTNIWTLNENYSEQSKNVTLKASNLLPSSNQPLPILINEADLDRSLVSSKGINEKSNPVSQASQAHYKIGFKTLIVEALLRSPNRSLTSAEIIKAIMSKHPDVIHRKSYVNSIRSTLTRSRIFVCENQSMPQKWRLKPNFVPNEYDLLVLSRGSEEWEWNENHEKNSAPSTNNTDDAEETQHSSPSTSTRTQHSSPSTRTRTSQLWKLNEVMIDGKKYSVDHKTKVMDKVLFNLDNVNKK